MTNAFDWARCAVLLPAAGSGSRSGASGNKLLVQVAGQPLLAYALQVAASLPVGQIVVVCRDDERGTMERIANELGASVTWASGGSTRAASVGNGLLALHPGIEVVAVHDAARPLVTRDLFEVALRSAAEHGSGLVAAPVTDTLRWASAEYGSGVLDRSQVLAMQTPQAVTVELLRVAYAQAGKPSRATDEAGLLEAAGLPLHFVPGTASNLKVTGPEDFALAEALLIARQHPARAARQTTRIGFGYDIHQLTSDRELWLGGVQLEHSTGLLGHSDADVLTHAICDALLGAIGDGDIGRHFPNTEPAYAGAASLDLLRAVTARLTQAGWQVGNIDATVVAEAPKLAPHVPIMIARLAEAVGIEPSQISLKATTNEKLDDVGAERGICAHAVALVNRSS